MGRSIRLFPSYSQKENQTTNHCLLILKMLYEENPKFLSEVLDSLIGEDFAGAVGVRFIQQPRKKHSIPDGAIFQSPFSIFIETKLGSGFGEQQLLNHLKALEEEQGNKILIALGNFEQDPSEDSAIKSLIDKAKARNIIFLAVSFEQFIQSIQLPYLSKNLADAVSDLREYFDENGLLPSWKYRLDVVNCRGSFDIVIKHKVYICPAQGGAYQHRRSLYFGTYRNKTVERVAKVEAVVDLETENDANLIWNNSNHQDNELIKIARDRYIAVSISAPTASYPARVFILSDLSTTNFRKTSSGGMFGSKKYFDITQLQVASSKDLAVKLQGKTWEDYDSE